MLNCRSIMLCCSEFSLSNLYVTKQKTCISTNVSLVAIQLTYISEKETINVSSYCPIDIIPVFGIKGAHISVDGRTFFWVVRPVCVRFWIIIAYRSTLLLGECMDKLPGARFMSLCARMTHKIKPWYRTLHNLEHCIPIQKHTSAF